MAVTANEICLRLRHFSHNILVTVGFTVTGFGALPQAVISLRVKRRFLSKHANWNWWSTLESAQNSPCSLWAAAVLYTVCLPVHRTGSAEYASTTMPNIPQGNYTDKNRQCICPWNRIFFGNLKNFYQSVHRRRQTPRIKTCPPPRRSRSHRRFWPPVPSGTLD